jgi:hypothetical protein
VENLSELAAGSLAVTGQGTDQVGDNSHAMTAPGTRPAQDVSPSRADPPAAEVTALPGPRRQVPRPSPYGGAWDHVSGQAWGES